MEWTIDSKMSSRARFKANIQTIGTKAGSEIRKQELTTSTTEEKESAERMRRKTVQSVRSKRSGTNSRTGLLGNTRRIGWLDPLLKVGLFLLSSPSCFATNSWTSHKAELNHSTNQHLDLPTSKPRCNSLNQTQCSRAGLAIFGGWTAATEGPGWLASSWPGY